MRQPISVQVRTAIMDAHFHGATRDHIASKTRKARSTVSREIENFKNEVDSKGLRGAAEEYGLSQIVEELHGLSVELKKNKITALEAKQGADVAGKMKLLQISADTLSPFITNVYNRSKEKNYAPSNIVDQCATIAEIELQYELTFQEVKTQFETMGSKLAEMKDEKKKLEKDLSEFKRSNANLWHQYDVDKKDLEQFRNTREDLAQAGLNIEELEKTKTVLNTIKKENQNPKSIIRKIVEIEDLDARKSALEESYTQANEKLEKINKEISIASTQIKEKQVILEEASKIEDTGLTVKDIQAIRNTVVRVASNHGVTSVEALKKIQSDITVNYDKSLGLEPVVSSLVKRKEKLEKEISEKIEELAEEKRRNADSVAKLKATYNTMKSQVDSYADLRSKGVTDKELKKWADLITESDLDPRLIEEELKTQRNLKNIEKNTDEKIKTLKKRETALNSSITILESKRNSIEESIEAVKLAGVKKIQDTANSASKQAKTTLNKVTQRIQDTANSASKQAETTLKTMNDAIVDMSQKTNTTLKASNQMILEITENAKKSLEATDSSLEHLSDQVNSVIAEAVKAGENIGRINPIAEAYQFIDVGVGEPKVVVPMTIKYLTNLRTWLKNKDKLGILDQQIDTIINCLRIEN